MLSSKLIVKNSSHGKGIFANEDIKKGELLIQFEGDTISREKADELYSTGFDYMLQVDSNLFLVLKEDSKYVNHSCNPNSFFKLDAFLVSSSDIKKGEEITFDYSSNENTEFKINCLCGNEKCRKVILPFNDLTLSEKNKLKPILSPHLKKIYKLLLFFSN